MDRGWGSVRVSVRSRSESPTRQTLLTRLGETGSIID
jgi:hypothetical protein